MDTITAAQQGPEDNAVERRIAVEGMTCGTCVTRVGRALKRVEGVRDAEVSLATHEALVTLEPGVADERLIQALTRAGYEGDIIPEAAEDGGLGVDPREAREVQELAESRRMGIEVVIGALLALPLVGQMVWTQFGIGPLPGWAQLALAVPVQLGLGRRFLKPAWGALRAGVGNMDLLVVLGTWAAFGLSLYLWVVHGQVHHLYFEAAAAVIVLVLFGRWMEGRARRATGAAIRALAALRPDTALRRTPDGNDVEVAVTALRPGDVLSIRPGERIAADARVIEGEGAADESMLTGESLPVTKRAGDTLSAGTVNGPDPLLARIVRVGRDTTLAQVVRMVEHAQATRAPVQALVDRVSAVFVPAVILIALATFAGWVVTGTPWPEAIIHAVTVLVIACPCAMGLATPAAIVAGTGAAAKAGILVRSPAAFDHGVGIDLALIDKTGTLTEGRPQLLRMIGATGTALARAAGLQQASEHPLARAIRAAADAEDVAPVEVAQRRNRPGAGVEGVIAGLPHRLGSRRFMTEAGVEIPAALRAEADAAEAEGATVVWLAAVPEAGGPDLLGGFVLADAPRSDAAAAVKALGDRGITVKMLSGDAPATAQAVAARLGISEAVGGADPARKAAVVAEARAAGRRVMMVGDGVNDAPALAGADLSVAIGGGTDVAMAAADVTLMRQSPSLLPATLDICRATRVKIRQNLVWAFGYNVIGIPLAALGILDPVFAGAAMAASSVSVLGNALLLARWRPAGMRERAA
ncbi:heavy metal translocating P-type ATPase [Tistrella mobilis]|uniref:heavy metal translocating P-type ATPase n=1 Tax=Tistrella mobilis TaxID=171437 RepID=UPI003558BF5D